jgi:hypothetical protein
VAEALSARRCGGPGPSPRLVCVLAAIVALTSAVAFAQEQVTIALPVSVNFSVFDVTSAATGTPSPTTISYSSLTLTAGHSLVISVSAAATAFAPPGGTGVQIPADKVSWHATGAANGTGSDGTVSASSFVQVFQSVACCALNSGSVNLEWHLAAPGGGVRAGAHTLTLRWKLESI